MKSLDDILPMKKYPHDPRLAMPERENGYNDGLAACKSSLEKALREGVLCWCPSEFEMATAMQRVDFDVKDLVMLKGERYQIVSMTAGMKLATAILSLLKNKKDPKS